MLLLRPMGITGPPGAGPGPRVTVSSLIGRDQRGAASLVRPCVLSFPDEVAACPTM